MNIQLLKSFLVVAECKSFTQAAEYLNFTQPAISSHITTLEKIYDATFFQRNGKTVYLTEAGMLFQESAEKIVNEYENSLAKIQSLRQKRTVLKIAVSTQFINYFLMDVLYDFHKKFPDLVIEVHRCMTVDSTIRETFIENIYDFAFVHLEVQPLYTKRILLWKQQVLWVVNDHLYKMKKSNNITDYPLIFYPQSSVYYRLKDQSYLRDVKSNFTYSDSETIKLAVKKGLGAALLPKIKIKNELECKEFIAIAPDHSLELPISLIYKFNMEITPEIQYLFALLQEHAKTI